MNSLNSLNSAMNWALEFNDHLNHEEFTTRNLGNCSFVINSS